MMSVVSQILLVITTILLLVVIYFLYKYTYWLRKKVPYIKPVIPFGNFKQLFSGQKQLSVIGFDLYNNLKSRGKKYGGIYFMHEAIFMPTDLGLVKQILLLDFDSFSERGVYFNEKNDPLSLHLFNLPTKPWKALRSRLTPTFTSGKIRVMFDTITQCSNELINVCEKNLNKAMDINDLVMRYSVDIIGQCAFGLECNSLRNPDEKFKEIADRVKLPPLTTGLKLFLSLMGPNIVRLGNMTMMEKPVIRFFLDIVEQNVHYRETNNIRRNDFFQLLIDMKNQDEIQKEKCSVEMNLKSMAAQTFVFFAAGFETSTMTINMCLFELTQNLDIQNKMRAEIRNVLEKHEGKITYDAIQSMTYLHCIVQETLRKHPPLGFLNRVCTKDYKIPESHTVIEKGTRVFISTLGIQRDPEHFPNPDYFDPDRFNDINKDKIPTFAHMPFGEGHRICIGERFGLIQTKVCLASLIHNFKFTLNEETKLPLVFNAASFVWTLKNPLLFNVSKI